MTDEALKIMSLEQNNVSNGDESKTPALTVPEKELRNKVDQQSLSIVNEIVNIEDPKELDSYLEKFNQNMSKKNILRILKMNELSDKVVDEAIDRIENHPDELTHQELINYIKVSQEAINTKKNEVSTLTPITLNQQNNNINVSVDNKDDDNIRVDRRSKERIIDAVSKLLKLSMTMPKEDIIEENIEKDKTQENIEKVIIEESNKEKN